MSQLNVSSGVEHELPNDLRDALVFDDKVLSRWESLTPLARNEWICWVTSVKKEETRINHIHRMVNELGEGKRRPCCWIGCIHRNDKEISPSIRGILARKSKTNS